MKLLVISENAVYGLGGAERSLYSYVCSISDYASKITVICAKNVYDELPYRDLAKSVSICELSNFSVFPFKGLYLFVAMSSVLFRFPMIYKMILNSDVVITQNRWAPYVALIFWFVCKVDPVSRRELKIFARDEKCLLVYRCYAKGVRKLLWWVRHIVESPWRVLHKMATSWAYKKYHVTYNSNFMRNLAKQQGLLSCDHDVVPPNVSPIDKEKCFDWLVTQPSEIREISRGRDENVVLLGGEVVKGVDVVLKLSSIFPENKFIIFSKTVSEESNTGNLWFLPWCSVPGAPFVLAKTVVVPSLWLEAFGRVVVEAKQFGCNIIVSNQGGLLEAMGDYPNGRVARCFDDYARYIEEFNK